MQVAARQGWAALLSCPECALLASGCHASLGNTCCAEATEEQEYTARWEKTLLEVLHRLLFPTRTRMPLR